MSLTTTLTAGIGADFITTVGLNSTYSIPMGGSYSVSLATGVAASTADLVYSATRTLTASASENLDLSGDPDSPFNGSVLKGPTGIVLVFAKVKALLFTAASGNTNSVVVGNHATAAFTGPFNAATDTVTIPPNGAFMVTAPVGGWTVTATTADLIKVLNSAGTTSVTYTVVIIGTSA